MLQQAMGPELSNSRKIRDFWNQHNNGGIDLFREGTRLKEWLNNIADMSTNNSPSFLKKKKNRLWNHQDYEPSHYQGKT